MPKLTVKGEVNAPAETVWQTISQFGGVERFMPVIASSALEGNGAGAVRVCTMGDGGQLVERLEEVDDESLTLKYIITDSGPLPVKDYVSTMTVRALDENKSEVEWIAIFEVVDAPQDKIVGLMESAYAQGIEGLDNLLAS